MVRLERDDHFPERAYTHVFETKEALKCKPEKENQTWRDHSQRKQGKDSFFTLSFDSTPSNLLFTRFLQKQCCFS